MNVILERKAPYIKQPMDYTIIGLYIVLYRIIPIQDYINVSTITTTTTNHISIIPMYRRSISADENR